MKYTFRISLILIWVLLGYCVNSQASAAEDVVVIVNKKNPNIINRAYVAKIYTGEIRGWPDGSALVAVDVKEDPELRESFYTEVVGKSMANMRAIWSQNIFTGRGLPPKMLPKSSAVINFVMSNRNAIGFVSAADLDEEAKQDLKSIER